MMTDRDFWIQVRRGLLLVVAAIETRWSLPRGSVSTLGASPVNGPATHPSEPPQQQAPARSSTERVEA